MAKVSGAADVRRRRRASPAEQITADALRALPGGWAVVGGVAWPGRNLSDVGHVAVGPSGVFPILSRERHGRVSIDDDVLRENGRAREAEVRRAATAASVLADLLLRVRSSHVHAVICVSGCSVDGVVGEVVVCQPQRLVAWLTSGDRVLGGDQVRDLEHQLASLVAAGPQRRGDSPFRRRGMARMDQRGRRSV